MRSTRKVLDTLRATTALALCLGVCQPLLAAVQLSTDWQARYMADGTRVPDDQHETSLLERAVAKAAKARTALSANFLSFEESLSFKLFIDGKLYYLAPVRFMAKSRPDEQCHPAKDKGKLLYMCDEGQRQTQDCHLLIFNAKFEEAGYLRLPINEMRSTFCNAIPAVGAGRKERNELLVTTQYFFIDAAPAKNASDIGSGWKRMTSLVKIHEEEGRVVMEQDSSCLLNPNSIDSVPEARRRLATCELRIGHKQ